MADVITRFKLETTQYDSKLRDASKSLADLTHHLSMAGKDFERFAKNHVQTAASLGHVASGATNLKDKLKDLVGAYNTAARAYNTLTKEQQSGDFGKAMAASLQKLKQDITQTKNELYNIGEQSKGTGGIMDMLAQKITVNIDAMKLFNAGLMAADTAFKVAKDAFLASEANIDEWGRTVKSAQYLYEGFLTAINNSDISGYLSRMNEIVTAARDAYNAIDTLGTMRTIQAPAISGQQTENERLRYMIQTGRYIAPANGTPEMKNGTVLTKEQIKGYEQQLQAGMNNIVGLVKNEVNQTGVAIDAYYKGLAQINGMSLQEFRKGTSTWDEFQQKIKGYEEYKKWDANAQAEFFKQGGRGFVDFDKSNPYAEFRKWGNFRVDKMGENSFNDLVSLIKQRDQQTSQMYSMMGQSYRTINRAEGLTVRNIMNGGGGGGGGRAPKPEEKLPVGSIADLNKQMQELRKAQDMATDTATWTSYEDKINAVLLKIKVLKGELNSSAITFGGSGLANASGVATSSPMTREDLIAKGNNKITGPGNLSETLTQQAQEAAAKQAASAKAVEESWRKAGNAVGTFGNILGSLKDPAAKIGATVAQAIASVALAYADTLAKDQTTKSNIWAFIAASAAAMVSMATTISSIHSSTGYASGGVIPGNSFSGDNQWVRVNAGETILTEAQSGVLASRLQNNTEGFVLETAVRGDDLRLILRRGNMKRGHGSRNLVL